MSHVWSRDSARVTCGHAYPTSDAAPAHSVTANGKVGHAGMRGRCRQGRAARTMCKLDRSTRYAPAITAVISLERRLIRTRLTRGRWPRALALRRAKGVEGRGHLSDCARYAVSNPRATGRALRARIRKFYFVFFSARATFTTSVLNRRAIRAARGVRACADDVAPAERATCVSELWTR